MTSKSKSFTTETKLVRELAIIFDEKDLTELELETDDISIRLARSQKDQQIVTMPQQAVDPNAQNSAPAVVSTPDAISEHSTNTTSSVESMRRRLGLKTVNPKTCIALNRPHSNPITIHKKATT